MKQTRFFVILVILILSLSILAATVVVAQEAKGAEATHASLVNAPLAGPSVMGTLTTTSPIWDRMFGSAVDLGCNASMTDSTNDGQYYAAIAFGVTSSSPITVEVNAAGTSIGDTVIAIYCDPFDPLTPLANVVAYDDDGGSGTLSAFTAGDNLTLTPGNNYVLILSTFNGGVTGDYQIDFSDNVTLSGAAPSIALNKTVGTDPSTCAATNDIDVPPNSNVYYCYEVTNTGNITFAQHDLVDSELGTILSGFPFALIPGASVWLTQSTTITQTTVNTATWTVYNPGPADVVSATASAIVNVIPPAISLSKSVGLDPSICSNSSSLSVAANTDVTYCFEVTNTGLITLTVHDLSDSELGTILSGFPFALAPGASVWLTQSATITQTTVNTATWQAYNPGPVDVAQDTASATVSVQTEPSLSLNPTSLVNRQGPDIQATLPLTIRNVGTGDLAWSIDEGTRRPAAPLGVGPYITSTFTTAPPTIDGTIATGEWDSAFAQDISVVANPVMMYITHDDNTLYLAFTDMNDAALDAFDQIGIYFDDEGGTPPILFDDLWTNPTCSAPNMGEGNYWLGNLGPDDQWREWIPGPTACTPQIGGTNAAISYSVASGNMVYEAAIPLDGTSALVANTGDTFGYRVYVLDNATGAFNGRFPAVSTFNDPSTYGNLHLSSGVTCQSGDVPWASVSPVSGTVAAGGADVVDVTFDSTGYATGVYTGTLCVNSNDLSTPLQLVPLTMTVSSVTIVDPMDGQTFTATNNISVTVDVTVLLDNFSMPTDGHWHLWVDGHDLGPVFTTTTSVDLWVGPHTIAAELRSPSHVSYGIVDTITVTVVPEVYLLYLPVIMKP